MDLRAFEWCIFIIFFSFPSSDGTEAEAWKVRWCQKMYQDGYQPFVFLRRFAMRKEVLCRRSIFLEINMVILWLGFLILFLVSLVRRRVLILRIVRRLLLLRMNGVVMVFLLGGLVRGLFLLLILVWIWLLLRKKLNQTEQSLPSTESDVRLKQDHWSSCAFCICQSWNLWLSLEILSMSFFHSLYIYGVYKDSQSGHGRRMSPTTPWN